MMMGSVSGDGFTSTPVSLRDRRPGRFGFLHRHYHDPIVAVPARIPVEIHLEWAEHRLGQPGIIGLPDDILRALAEGKENDAIGVSVLGHVLGQREALLRRDRADAR